jgi:hypothetical protein
MGAWGTMQPPIEDNANFLYKFIQKNKTKGKVHYPKALTLTTLRRFINTDIREICVNETIFMQFITKYWNNKRLIKVSDNYDMPKRVLVKFNPIFTVTCLVLPQRRGRPRVLSGEVVKRLIKLRKKRESIRSIAELLDLKKSTVLDYIHKLQQEGILK